MATCCSILRTLKAVACSRRREKVCRVQWPHAREAAVEGGMDVT